MRWHHQLNGHEFEQAPGVGDGQGSQACCSPWGLKESDTTERLSLSLSKRSKCLKKMTNSELRSFGIMKLQMFALNSSTYSNDIIWQVIVCSKLSFGMYVLYTF